HRGHEDMSSPTFGVFSVGSYGSGVWTGEFQSQGMMMSNGIFYSQGMEISSFSGGGSSGGSSDGWSGGSSGGLSGGVSGGSSGGAGGLFYGSSGSGGAGATSGDPLSPTLPGFAGIPDASGADWPGGGGS